jgi:hypothetical protein
MALYNFSRLMGKIIEAGRENFRATLWKREGGEGRERRDEREREM